MPEAANSPQLVPENLVAAGFMLGTMCFRDCIMRDLADETKDWDGDAIMLEYIRSIAAGEFTPVDSEAELAVQCRDGEHFDRREIADSMKAAAEVMARVFEMTI